MQLFESCGISSMFFILWYKLILDKYLTAYACEGRRLHLECPDRRVISLIRANYGRFSIAICNKHGQMGLRVDCMTPHSRSILEKS